MSFHSINGALSSSSDEFSSSEDRTDNETASQRTKQEAIERFALQQSFETLRLLQNTKLLNDRNPERTLALMQQAQNSRLLLAYSLDLNVPVVAVPVSDLIVDRENPNVKRTTEVEGQPVHERAVTSAGCCIIS